MLADAVTVWQWMVIGARLSPASRSATTRCRCSRIHSSVGFASVAPRWASRAPSGRSPLPIRERVYVLVDAWIGFVAHRFLGRPRTGGDHAPGLKTRSRGLSTSARPMRASAAPRRSRRSAQARAPSPLATAAVRRRATRFRWPRTSSEQAGSYPPTSLDILDRSGMLEHHSNPRWGYARARHPRNASLAVASWQTPRFRSGAAAVPVFGDPWTARAGRRAPAIRMPFR